MQFGLRTGVGLALGVAALGKRFHGAQFDADWLEVAGKQFNATSIEGLYGLLNSVGSLRFGAIGAVRKLRKTGGAAVRQGEHFDIRSVAAGKSDALGLSFLLGLQSDCPRLSAA